MNSLKDAEIIKQSRMASNAAILKKDVEGVSKYWLPDFVQIAGDGSHTVGKSQILADWKYMFAHSSPIFQRLPLELATVATRPGSRELGFIKKKATGEIILQCGARQKVNG